MRHGTSIWFEDKIGRVNVPEWVEWLPPVAESAASAAALGAVDRLLTPAAVSREDRVLRTSLTTIVARRRSGPAFAPPPRRRGGTGH